MMGYRVEPKIYRLRFEAESYDGLVVRARSVPMSVFLRLTKLKESLDTTGNNVSDSIESFNEMMDSFSKAIVSWNVEDESGDPVPCTPENVMSQDADFVLDIMLAWMDAIASVPAPLVERSSNGATSVEELIPMEVL